jgi:hypothetical protein
MLKSDSNGFLVSDKGEQTDVLKDIKDDTGKILAIMGRAPRASVSTAMRGPAANSAAYSSAAGRVVESARVRNEAVAVRSAMETAEAVRSLAMTQETARRQAKAVTQTRNANGQFASSKAKAGKSRFSLAGLGGAAGSAAGAIQGAERLDPLIEAMAEASSAAGVAKRVVSPVGRTMAAIVRRRSASEKEQRDLAKKQLAETKAMRKDAKAARSGAGAASRWRSMFGGPGASGSNGGEGGGFWSNALSYGTGAVGGVGLAALLAKGKGLWNSGKGMLSGLGDKGKGLLSGVGKAGMGFIKKIPLIGNIINALTGYGENERIENDSSLTPEQKRSAKIQNVGGTAGSIVGTVVGAMIGGAIAGPIGAAVGGTLLGWIGGEGGKMIAEPIVEVGDWMQERWDAAVTSVQDAAEALQRKWDDAVKTVQDAFAPAAQLFKDLGDWLSNLPGFRVAREVVNRVGQGVMDLGGATLDRMKSAATGAADWVGGKASDKWNSVKSGLANAAIAAGADPALVAKIAGFESGFNTSARPVSRDATKNKVRQFDGTMAISSANGLGQFTDDTWRSMVNRYGEKYGIAGASKMNRSQANALRGDAGLQQALLAEHTRDNTALGRKLGGKDDAANVYALHNLGEGDGAKFLSALKSNPSAMVRDVLGPDVIRNNPALYGNGAISLSDAYKKMGGAMSRFESYGNEARALAGPAAIGRAGLSPTLPAAFVPPAPAPVTIPPAPADAGFTRLNTPPPAPSAAPAVVLPGQDVSDRTIAHIVSGGITPITRR